MQIPIDLVGGTNRNRSKRIAETKCINLVPELVASGGRSTSVYHGAPGTIEKYNFGSHCRGLTFFDNKIWSVFGDKFHYIEESTILSPTEIGDIPNDGDFVYIGSGNNVVAVGNNTSTLYYANSSTLQTLSVNSRKTGGGCFIDGKFVFNDPNTNQWWSTESNSAITVDILDTEFTVSKSDNLKTTFNHDQLLLLVGEDTIEVWPTASSGNPPFSKSVTIPIGTIAKNSCASLLSGMCFLGTDKQVYQLNGYTPISISNNSQSDIRYFLENATQAQIEKAFAFSYKQNGGEYYWLTIPEVGTFVYDQSTALWHQRSSGTQEGVHKANCYVKAWGNHYLGTSDGKLVQLDLDTYTEETDTIKQVRSFRLTLPEGEYTTLDKLVIIHDTGTETTTAEPKMGVRYSKDSGMSWSEKEPITMGKHGDYRNETWLHQFGSARTFDIEIYNTNACRVSIAGAYAEVS